MEQINTNYLNISRDISSRTVKDTGQKNKDSSLFSLATAKELPRSSYSVKDLVVFGNEVNLNNMEVQEKDVHFFPKPVWAVI